MDITPQSVRDAIKDKQHATAIMLACKLNEEHLKRQAVETVPVSDSKCEKLLKIYMCVFLLSYVPLSDTLSPKGQQIYSLFLS